MQLEVQGLALRIVKYSDSASMATIWTRQAGRMSVVLPSGSGRTAQRLRALMMPLGIFEGIATIKPGKECTRLGGVRSLVPSPAASGQMAKSALCMFLTDFLYAALKESAPDSLLADFLMESAQALNVLPSYRVANFHLVFLYRLSRFLGIEPDMGSYFTGKFFDMRDSVFTESLPMHSAALTPQEASVVKVLSRLSYANMHKFKLNRQQRNSVLDRIIDYYTLHYCPVNTLSSLPVMRSLFA